MVEDNTPTVNTRTRKPQSTRARLRLETAKQLQGLATQAKAKKLAAKKACAESVKAGNQIFTRKPRPKGTKDVPNRLATPPKPVAPFRKRQIHKTWLPTHIFHAKRAHMTPPKEPLWRFAMPLQSTEKSYRPTHRANSLRGAIAWDTSYMSTIALEGSEQSVCTLLRALGVGAGSTEQSLWQENGRKWREGKRVWEGWAFEKNRWPMEAIAPVMIVWCALGPSDDHTKTPGTGKDKSEQMKPVRRKLLLRVHPSAFLQLWNELLPLAKMQYPPVMVEDLRFEIGSIELIGPGSTEALQGILKPIEGSGDMQGTVESPASTWTSLAGLTNPGSLPRNAVLGFSVSDPRLHHPPHAKAHTLVLGAEDRLLDILSQWPPDQWQLSPTLFHRTERHAAGRQLQSQKAINRRKSLALAGAYPAPLPTDPQIPVLLLASRPSSSGQGTWTVLLPWKCVLPVWYTLVHYPLSFSGSVRFGGLSEQRQTSFERGIPWFPADYPGTKAGWEWEVKERERRKGEWESKPKGKRTEWASVNLGGGRKGEIGRGWACDWERLVLGHPIDAQEAQKSEKMRNSKEKGTQESNAMEKSEHVIPPSKIAGPQTGQGVAGTSTPSYACKMHVDLFPVPHASQQPAPAPLNSPDPSVLSTALFTVKVILLSRGTPTSCARIYRLPAIPSKLRRAWLDLKELGSHGKKNNHPKRPKSLGNESTPEERRRALAASLLTEPTLQDGLIRAGDANYPVVPDEEDLIGFITTGNFSLSEGRGVGIGCIATAKAMDKGRGTGPEKKLCIIREAGSGLGRLARWEIV